MSISAVPLQITHSNLYYQEVFETLDPTLIWQGDNVLEGWGVLKSCCAVKSGTAGGLRYTDIGSGKTLGGLATGDKALGFGVTFYNARSNVLINLPLTFDAFCSKTNQSLTRLVLTARVDSSLPDLNDDTSRTEILAYSLQTHPSPTTIATTIPLPVPPEHFLQIRWKVDASTKNDIVGIDNLLLRWEDSPVTPQEEPTSPPETSPLADPVAINHRGYHQAFNGSPGNLSELQSLPAGWSVVKASTIQRAPYPSLAEQAISYANQFGTNAVMSSDVATYPADIYYYAEAVAPDQMLLEQSERALGGRLATTLKTIQLILGVSNATARAINQWEVHYNLEYYRTSSNTNLAVTLYASTNALHWQSIATNRLDAVGITPSMRPLATHHRDSFLLPTEPSTPLYLAWVMAPLQGSNTANAPDVALDDIHLYPLGASVPILLFIH